MDSLTIPQCGFPINFHPGQIPPAPLPKLRHYFSEPSSFILVYRPSPPKNSTKIFGIVKLHFLLPQTTEFNTICVSLPEGALLWHCQQYLFPKTFLEQ